MSCRFGDIRCFSRPYQFGVCHRLFKFDLDLDSTEFRHAHFGRDTRQNFGRQSRIRCGFNFQLELSDDGWIGDGDFAQPAAGRIRRDIERHRPLQVRKDSHIGFGFFIPIEAATVCCGSIILPVQPERIGALFFDFASAASIGQSDVNRYV